MTWAEAQGWTRGTMFWNGAWTPKRKVKRGVRRAMERDGGFSRGDCYGFCA